MKSAALFLVQTLLGKPPKLSSYPVRWGGGEDEVLPKPCPLNLSDSIYARFKLHNYIPKNSSVRISRKHVNHSSTEKIKKAFENLYCSSERRRAKARNFSSETLYGGQFTLRFLPALRGRINRFFFLFD